MPDITKKELDHLARLSRLHVIETESKKYTKDLNAIVDYFKELEAVDTAGVEPMIGAAHAKNVLREDEPQPRNSEKITAAFPSQKKGYLTVPKIL